MKKNDDGDSQRLILRAELIRSGKMVVAHTVELSDSSMFVRTDETASIGDRILVRLSFPNLFSELELEAHVVSKRLSTGPGQAAGLTLAYVFRDNEESDRLATLLDRFRHNVTEDGGPRDPDKSGQYRALLVEDSALIRDMLLFGARKHLRGTAGPVQIDIAEDGEQAWKMLGDHSYDMAIVDFYLPGQSGAELVKRMRAAPNMEKMTIVAISVDAAQARESFMEVGADIFLDKPLVIRDFFATLKHLISAEAKS